MSTHEYEYKEIHEEINEEKSILSKNDISLISDLEVNIDVFVGTAKLSVVDLYDLKNGAVVKLEQDVESLVDIRINGNVFARGILSVVDDNYAVMITESINEK